jgi:hypothetical protein
MIDQFDEETSFIVYKNTLVYHYINYVWDYISFSYRNTNLKEV